jgi:uncharacterized membrane protein YidH (DUF202 family)
MDNSILGCARRQLHAPDADQPAMPVDRHVLANERTLMAWLRLAATLGLGAFLVGVLNKVSTHAMPGAFGLGQSLVAILIGCVATMRFYQRDILLKQRHMGDAFGDWLLPSLAGVTILFIVGFNVTGILTRWWEWQFQAQNCLALTGWQQVPRAPQPHVYISMHGSGSPAENICHPELGVSGIHKFSLVTGARAPWGGIKADGHKGGWVCGGNGGLPIVYTSAARSWCLGHP